MKHELQRISIVEIYIFSSILSYLSYILVNFVFSTLFTWKKNVSIMSFLLYCNCFPVTETITTVIILDMHTTIDIFPK